MLGSCYRETLTVDSARKLSQQHKSIVDVPDRDTISLRPFIHKNEY